MLDKVFRILVFLLTCPLALRAVPADQPTPVYNRAAGDAAVIKIIRAGDELPAIAEGRTAAAGWAAVELAGPHEVYVQNAHISKSLDVKDGSPLHVSPNENSLVLATSSTEDDVTITGLRGRWTQLRLNQPVIGYVKRSNAAVTGLHTIATTTLRDAPDPAASGVTASAPQPDVPRTGRAVPRSSEERSSLAALPRLFEGKLASTRVPLRPRRPYDFGLEDDGGTRFAYLDLSRLLLTEQIEKYLNRTVVVYGVARPVPDTKDIVIAVESLQLR